MEPHLSNTHSSKVQALGQAGVIFYNGLYHEADLADVARQGLIRDQTGACYANS